MRRDVFIVNDAGGWSVVAADALEAILKDGREHDERFVKDAKAALFLIEGDDYSVVRVVAKEPLTEPEAMEWVGCTRWKIQTTTGKILISGGFDLDCLMEWQSEGETEYVKEIDVAPGQYQLTLYTYLHSMNGAVWLSSFNDVQPLPHLLPWFRHDHPSRALPTWLVAMLEDEDLKQVSLTGTVAKAIQSGQLLVEQQPLHWIGYLVHLMPTTPEMALDTPAEDGWFNTRQGIRVPEQCPLGISTECKEDTQIKNNFERLLGQG